MDKLLRAHADAIIKAAISAVQPDTAVERALSGRSFLGRVILIAVGKAAWQMANAAHNCLGDRIDCGVVITKYGHVKGPIGQLICCEAGHPIPDENSFSSTQIALDLVQSLKKEDTVLFLLSGGGSALFEQPIIPGDELKGITMQLLSRGADIVEINTIRKRLSSVKGGRFAQHCAPAQVLSIILSDVLGDPLDMIASGPTAPDSSTTTQALAVAEKYHLSLSDETWRYLRQETPKVLDNVTNIINGSVRELCAAAAFACKDLGYEPLVLTDQMCCQAKEAGLFLSAVVKTHMRDGKNLAFLAGGETVVQLTGSGKGGRNQEIALSAADGISDLIGAAVFSVGSDGTDGPTDAAGGYVDYSTTVELKKLGIDIHQVLTNNDAYNALKETGGLVFTGPTGTNVNDVAVALIHYE